MMSSGVRSAKQLWNEALWLSHTCDPSYSLISQKTTDSYPGPQITTLAGVSQDCYLRCTMEKANYSAELPVPPFLAPSMVHLRSQVFEGRLERIQCLLPSIYPL